MSNRTANNRTAAPSDAPPSYGRRIERPPVACGGFHTFGPTWAVARIHGRAGVELVASTNVESDAREAFGDLVRLGAVAMLVRKSSRAIAIVEATGMRIEDLERDDVRLRDVRRAIETVARQRLATE